MTRTPQRRDVLLATVGWAAGATFAQAPSPGPQAPAELDSELPGARLQGQGQLRFLGLRVYAIHLWTGSAPVAADWAGVPLALEIEYLRKLDGAQIAERSLVEMRRQVELQADVAERWLAWMRKTFPDVRNGDRLTGVNLPGRGARFFLNGRPQGELLDAEFARLFFGIWLSPRSSEPALREALLGNFSTPFSTPAGAIR